MVNIVSTFAGCGGSSLGYKWAGFKELLAIDFNQNATSTFKLNFPDVTVWTKDISDITGQDILNEIGLKKGELDLLDGSPPCQGFSTSGKRDVNDSRNDLTSQFIRLIREIQPKIFLIENVPGMVKGKMKGMYIEIMKTLKELDYQVKSAILDASYYGVPQSRERLIFIGVRNDLNKQPSFPKPQKRTIIADIPELGNIYAINSGQYAKIWRFNKRPSPTLTKTKSLYCEDINCKTRDITINEAKAICSFPQDFQLMGSISNQWARLGNAVMPKFMYYIAKHILENILLGSPNSPKQ